MFHLIIGLNNQFGGGSFIMKIAIVNFPVFEKKSDSYKISYLQIHNLLSNIQIQIEISDCVAWILNSKTLFHRKGTEKFSDFDKISKH